MFWNNKICWITGASSGIGEALARNLYDRGARVILSARSVDKLDSICSDWKDKDRFLILPLNMGDHEKLPAAAAEARKKWGRIDALINNAGVSQRSLAAETDFSVMKQIMDINYLGSAGLTRAVLPFMIEQKSGIIAPVSSVAGKFSTPLRTSYSASKMALQGFYDGLRAEVYDQGIQINLIIPGFVKTNISLNAMNATGGKHGEMDPNQASGISPEDAAEIILKGMEKNKLEIYMGIAPKVKLALFLSRNIPSLLAKMLRKAEVK
ncbi:MULTISPECIES: SDR family oxidoreductase [unclassified Oceanispirochaeta]|uniref:SDR family oxidoreductase n=1 Tax=unclassified Oceanispirochaeta TaxID=2635722 RepID=UPI000E08FC92|nr:MULTISPECIES: SDR family oxidoreductase [unclassified Oceanispirochaeta]MBF9018576.1 SDR family oxidoreductase [Oceanispirochaeta sp. M2]NPD75017.1 SDR family oxidoreductase [Oceanispirochaeta sp. M1]RDG29138.1 short chain dehydrogenase [Oceanispirochaeta sp. M1]